MYRTQYIGIQLDMKINFKDIFLSFSSIVFVQKQFFPLKSEMASISQTAGGIFVLGRKTCLHFQSLGSDFFYFTQKNQKGSENQ